MDSQEPEKRRRNIDDKIHTLEDKTEDFVTEGQPYTEMSTYVLARIGKNIRTIKNILVFWVILFCLGIAVVVISVLMR